ncbi:MAG TPA: DHA2 family efflux MFS transporter permease subunit [Planctomycetota bacterium]|jgi:DHA2 family multidrug resistance protein
MAADASSPDTAHAHWRPSHNPWLVALTVTLATFMEVLDTSIANVALPHIAGNLSASVDESTWVLTSYLVSNAIVLPLSGWLVMIFGRKRFYMACVAIFTVSSGLCGLASSLGMLVFFRILQGVGGGGLQPSEQAILVDTFPARQRGMGMAVYGIAVVTAPIIGPTLGGWITDNFSWRWIFFINIPVGLLSLFLTSRMVEDPPYLTRKPLSQVRIDYVGFALIALGLGALQIVLDKGQREDWFASHFILIMSVIGGVALIAAIAWELHREEAMVELHLLKDRNFSLSVLLMFMLGVVLFGSTVLLPLFLQTLMGYNATLAGMALSPGGMVTMLSMPLVGLLLSRYDARWLVAFGIAMVSAGLFYMTRFNTQIDFWTAATSRMIVAGGLGFLFVPINSIGYAYIRKEQRNQASGLINLARNLGGSFGIALVTTLLARRAQVHQNMLVGHLTPYDPAYQNQLQRTTSYLAAQTADPVQAAQQAHGLMYAQLNQQATMLAYLDCFMAMAVIFLALLPVVFLVRKTVPGKDAPMH